MPLYSGSPHGNATPPPPGGGSIGLSSAGQCRSPPNTWCSSLPVGLCPVVSATWVTFFCRVSWCVYFRCHARVRVPGRCSHTHITRDAAFFAVVCICFCPPFSFIVPLAFLCPLTHVFRDDLVLVSFVGSCIGACQFTTYLLRRPGRPCCLSVSRCAPLSPGVSVAPSTCLRSLPHRCPIRCVQLLLPGSCG